MIEKFRYLQHILDRSIFKFKIKKEKNPIEKLKLYCRTIDYDVIIIRERDESMCDPTSRQIIIKEEDNEIILWTLLHEIGHAHIFALSDYCSAFGLIAKQVDYEHDQKTNQYHYQKLKEEMLAWETGINVANSLKIEIDAEAYERHAAQCFMSYVYESSLTYYQLAAKNAFEDYGLEINFEPK